MKIVSPKEMAQLEALAYQQGHAERDFMERAGHGVALAAEAFIRRHRLLPIAWLLCGKGNNAGDAFVAGRHILERGYQATAIQPVPLEECSPLCQENGRRFLEKGGKLLPETPSFEGGGVILDGLFGTGFRGPVSDPYASLIEAANRSGLPILAIDIPSGLDGSTGRAEGSVIRAAETLFLGLPKIGFFLGNGWNVVGKLRAVDFGLPAAIIGDATAEIELTERTSIAALLPSITRNRHKYAAGYVIGLAGSPGMPGAALLSSSAALRGGSGMVRLLHPRGMEAELSSSPYELIKIPYSYEDPLEASRILEQAGATFVGPGIGRSGSVRNFLQHLMPNLTKPCVLDADALALFADEPFPLPAQTIFTPHTGEMQRLLHAASPLTLTPSLLQECQRYAEEHRITLILKGAPTFIFHPRMPIYVNPTGDPGMATAGSGDVLTGLLASLLSQGLSSHHAALLGVYVHGLAGECAAKKRRTSYGMMASDLLASFAAAYASLHQRHIIF